MANLSHDEILRIAELARLDIPKDEQMKVEKQFNDILKYVEQLSALNTEGIEPTTQVMAADQTLGTPMSPDIPHSSLSKEDAVRNAPDQQDQFFKVPRMIGE